MPLPDERPRPSVANLIGRFEQKHQSITSAVPPQLPPGFTRSTSVASHTTGDSVKEDILQRKEWLFKSTMTDERPKISSSSSAIMASPASLAKSLSVIEAAPLSPAESAATETGVKPPVAESSTKTPKSSTANPKSPQVRKASSTTAKVSAPRASATAKTPQKSPTSSRPLTSSVLSPPKSLPLKAQHTGTSTKSAVIPSTPSSVKQTKSSSKIPPSTSTPNARSKTPNITPRSKTPTSGLFAPTAASLAKARNAVPPVPTPVKKVTLSTSAAERLSKPTAASISKARSPAASPAVRTVKMSMSSSARGGAGAVSATVKPRMGLAVARMKEAAVTKNVSNGVAKEVAEAAMPATTTSVIETEMVGNQDDKSEKVERHDDGLGVTNGHDHELSGDIDGSHGGEESFEGHVEEPEEISQDLGEQDISHEAEPEDHVLAEEDAEDKESSIVVSSSSRSPEGYLHESEHEVIEPDAEVDDEESHIDQTIEHDSPAEPHYDDSSSRPAAVAEDKKTHTEEVAKPPRNDIDDIVNLLEPATSKSRPMSVANIPDDAPDIPDEE